MIFEKSHRPIQPRLTFKRDERLKSRKVIEQLFKEGKSFAINPFRVLYLFSDLKSPLQTGFAVSAKNFKKAVDRNRIKRLMREAYRLQKNILAQNLKDRDKTLAVFFIYTGNRMPEYKDVTEKINLALNRLQKIVNESTVGTT